MLNLQTIRGGYQWQRRCDELQTILLQTELASPGLKLSESSETLQITFTADTEVQYTTLKILY
jgi:hypothetical protein